MRLACVSECWNRQWLIEIGIVVDGYVVVSWWIRSAVRMYLREGRLLIDTSYLVSYEIDKAVMTS